jgi:hypothetical protein
MPDSEYQSEKSGGSRATILSDERHNRQTMIAMSNQSRKREASYSLSLIVIPVKPIPAGVGIVEQNNQKVIDTSF